MRNRRSFIYWDTNVFLTFFERVSDRIQTLDAVVAQVRQHDQRIVTSTFTKIEVAFVVPERVGRPLSAEIEQRLDAVWNDDTLIELVDLNDAIAHIARALIRDALPKGMVLRPKDAVHLASAKWVSALELHTYDKKLHTYATLLRIPVLDPHM